MCPPVTPVTNEQVRDVAGALHGLNGRYPAIDFMAKDWALNRQNVQHCNEVQAKAQAPK